MAERGVCRYDEGMGRTMTDDSIAPTLLISMPQMVDPNFAKAVVLLCEHTREGAFGLIVNRPSDTPAAEAVEMEPPPARDSGAHLWIGGPVEPQRGWILMAQPPSGEDAFEVADGLFLTTSPTVLREVMEQGLARSRVLTGYAGWAPGQLDAELAASAWLTTDVDVALVFDTPADEMWEAAIRRLGADPALLQASRGVH
jgi:putative transcriptional regulator